MRLKDGVEFQSGFSCLTDWKMACCCSLVLWSSVQSRCPSQHRKSISAAEIQSRIMQKTILRIFDKCRLTNPASVRPYPSNMNTQKNRVTAELANPSNECPESGAAALLAGGMIPARCVIEETQNGKYR